MFQMAKEQVEYSMIVLGMHWYKMYDYAVIACVT